MVALSAVSMNNLESFAVENFAASPLVLSFKRFSRALHSQERTIVVKKKRTWKKERYRFGRSATNRNREWDLQSYISNADELKNSFGRVLRIMVQVTGG